MVTAELNRMPCKYSDLKVGDIFSYGCKSVKSVTGWGVQTIKGDKRLYRREHEGALMIVDAYGNPCEDHGYKEYPYLSMQVFKVEEEERDD